MNAPPFRWQLLGPRYWPSWLGLGLLRLLCALPLPLALGAGEGLGWLAGRIAGSRRRIVRVNLQLCFPALSTAECEQRVDEHFKALGAGLIEAGLAWWASDAQLRAVSDLVGLEHFDKALASGSGVLLLTGHFTTLELGARIVAVHRPFHPMYRPLNNALMDYWMHRFRSARAGLCALPRDDLRALVRALREGRGIWYAPDQTLDSRNSVFVPFFGVPTLTITATSRLARLGRALVVPYFPQRVGSRYRIVFQPALENFPTEDEAADATRVNQAMEQGIRAAPAQYFWVHRRFKSRPPGMAPVY